ncbi:MAG TPA: 2-hydroxychromene-2-carboxylate isomerase [Rhodospirillaceae bacterium]|nr:2-hydroxychromene-2-carboxylate isomerase [Rhodospirillaceae bacterium]HAA92932.1 2-hydroxychromene-2-carboxylate isomerase [Rhodospirillaceae bacterium]HAT36668.1 2-hydroxychromene-2-carboxylate isomerase [Rhodospirillaceae bacterium]
MNEHKPIEFYFEFASPYGYFASVKIDGIAAKYGRTVQWRPIMLGAALQATGSQPNVLVPIKGDYFKNDIVRCAKIMGLAFTMPDNMPMNSLAASRAFYWLDDTDPAKAKQLAEAVYHAHWGLGRDMSDVDEVARVAEPLEIDGEALKAACQDQNIKDKLKDITMSSVDAGVFGSPFIIADGEQFWGHDRLDHLERWLGAGHW